MTSAFKINLEPGSASSLVWLNAMKQADNDEIFLSNLALLVDYKWEQVCEWIRLDGIIHLVYAVLLGVDAVFFDDDYGDIGPTLSKVFMIIYTLIMLAREMY